MNKENNINLDVLSDEDLDNVSGGVEASNLIFTGQSAKAVGTVQKGEPAKAGGLVFKETKKAKATGTLTSAADLDGILLSGGGDLKSC